MGLIKNFRSSLENPQTPLNYPQEWLLDFFNGGRTSSGIRVSEATALQIPSVFACVRIISEGVAALPLRLYERVGNGRTEATDLPLYRILHNAPNPEMTKFSFMETLQGHLCLWGNAYAEIQRDAANRVVALWPRHPYRTHPHRAANGDLWYVTTDQTGGQQRFIKSADMLHILGLSQEGVLGMSPVQQARQAMGLALATEKFGAQWFGNGSRPSGILSHPKKLDEAATERLRKSWEQAQGGERQNSVAVLEEGLSWSAIGLSPDESQFLETRKFQKSEIAAIFRVPPHMIADLERSTHSNIEQQSLEFVTYTLMPWLVRWEQEIERKLLPEGKPHGSASMGRNAAKEYFVEFALNGLVRGDFETRYAGYAIARQWGWMNADDVREQEGMNPMPNGIGQIYLVPMNMVDADVVAHPPVEPTSAEEVDDTIDGGTGGTGATIDAGATGASDRNAKILNRFVAGYYRIFRNEFTRALSDKADQSHLLKCFGPVLFSLAEMFSTQASSELRVDPFTQEQLFSFVQDFLAKMTTRSASWTEQNADHDAKEELGKAVRTLSIVVYREAATQKAKKETTAHA